MLSASVRRFALGALSNAGRRAMASSPKVSDSIVNVTFVNKRGEMLKVKGIAGQSLLEVAREHRVELDGLCEGRLACTGCHIHMSSNSLQAMGKASPEEERVLNDCIDVKSNSRLACQVVLSNDVRDLVVALADADMQRFP